MKAKDLSWTADTHKRIVEVMNGISKTTFQFLKDIKRNNNRDWFNQNKSAYESAKAEFESFIDGLIGRIVRFDPTIGHHTAKNCVFRIYRDVRFSKDKSPFKTNFGAHISAALKKSEIHSRAGYYIHIEPGSSMLAGGAYMPQGEWLKGIRQEIHYNAAAFRKILKSKSFTQYFGQIEGEKLKTAPKEYPRDHPDIELLKHKSYLAVHHCPDKLILSNEFMEHCSRVFKALYPFDQFLNKALD